MAYDGDVPIGTIVCKQEQHRDKLERGYLAMLSTKEGYRGRGVGQFNPPTQKTTPSTTTTHSTQKGVLTHRTRLSQRLNWRGSRSRRC